MAKKRTDVRFNAARKPGNRMTDMKITSILDAVEFVLKETYEPDTPYWLASQMEEMRLWRASEHDVRAELEMDINKLGERSRFVKMPEDTYGLRSWTRT